MSFLLISRWSQYPSLISPHENNMGIKKNQIDHTTRYKCNNLFLIDKGQDIYKSTNIEGVEHDWYQSNQKVKSTSTKNIKFVGSKGTD